MRRLLTCAVNGILRLLIIIIAAADTREFANVPANGPLIIVFNHVNFLEVPLLYLRLLPRPVHYIAKRETWNHPFRGWMADNWNAVSVDRSGDPTMALREAGEILQNGGIILMAPEGSRSEDGILRHGRSGAVLLALENDTPLLSIAHSGAQEIRRNLRRLRRTRVIYRVGDPYRLNGPHHPDRETRQSLADAIMRELADRLPAEMRGPYGGARYATDLLIPVPGESRRK